MKSVYLGGLTPLIYRTWGYDGGRTPIATTARAGKVKPDGSTLTIQPDGTIAATSGGTGTVTGPASSVVNNVPLWNNTAGTLLKDGYPIGAVANGLVQLNSDGHIPALNGHLLTGFAPTHYLYVDGGSSYSSGFTGSVGFPYKTIQAAITAASAGTTIFIWPGTYTESLTLKAGVNLTCPVQYGVYVVGNHTISTAGTVIVENIVLQNASSAASGTTLTVSGTGVVNLQLYNSFINSASTSGAGDAVVWTNSNASSRMQLVDGNISVAHSNASARAFYSATGAAGTIMANRATIQLDNPDNNCLVLGGAIHFIHTADAVTGQVIVSDTAYGIFTSVVCTSATQPVLTTNSSAMSVVMNSIIYTTASPVATGAGGLTVSAIIYGSTGVGANSTLNGGYGPIFLQMGPLRIRNSSALLPTTAVSAGLLDGIIEVHGTNAYITIGTTRYTFNLTAV